MTSAVNFPKSFLGRIIHHGIRECLVFSPLVGLENLKTFSRKIVPLSETLFPMLLREE